jgi:hypothetical protein
MFGQEAAVVADSGRAVGGDRLCDAVVRDGLGLSLVDRPADGVPPLVCRVKSADLEEVPRWTGRAWGVVKTHVHLLTAMVRQGAGL